MALKNAAVLFRQSRKRNLYAEELQIAVDVRFRQADSFAGVITANVCVQDLKN
jgi:hypothetical protein